MFLFWVLLFFVWVPCTAPRTPLDIFLWSVSNGNLKKLMPIDVIFIAPCSVVFFIYSHHFTFEWYFARVLVLKCSCFQKAGYLLPVTEKRMYVKMISSHWWWAYLVLRISFGFVSLISLLSEARRFRNWHLRPSHFQSVEKWILHCSLCYTVLALSFYDRHSSSAAASRGAFLSLGDA